MAETERSYVIVQEATRYRIISHPFVRPPTARKEDYLYHKHKLGLMHPKIVNFFEENPKHRRWRLSYPDKSILPVLMFDPSEVDRADGFFIAPFKMEELAVVSDPTLEGVLREFDKHKKTTRIMAGRVYTGEKAKFTLADCIEEHWRHLDSFYRTPTEGLMPLKRFREIPVEGVKFEVTDEDLKREIENIKKTQELDDYNRGGLIPIHNCF